MCEHVFSGMRMQCENARIRDEKDKGQNEDGNKTLRPKTNDGMAKLGQRGRLQVNESYMICFGKAFPALQAFFFKKIQN